MSLIDQKILGLTIHAPWGELIAMGKKPIENRSWPPYTWMLGRFIAVHQSTRWDQEGADYIKRNHPRFQLDPPAWAECKFGVIAVAQLVGWVQRTETGPPRVVQMLPGHGFSAGAFSDVDWRWFHGSEFGWVLRDVRRIAPVACSGRQKLWELPKLVYGSVRDRYGRALNAAGTTPL